MYRAPQHISLAAILAAPQPTIDLRVEVYEQSSHAFLDAVTKYTTRAIEEISRRRDADASRIQKDTERRKAIELEVAECKEKEVQLLKALEREQTERKDSESSVSALKRQLASVKEKCSKVDVEIDQVKTSIAALRKERKKEGKVLDNQAVLQEPELRGLESKLHCTIVGIQKDALLISFTHVDPADDSRDFSIVIDIADPLYKVPTSSPVIPTMPFLLEELNETREFYRFIKKVRHAFVNIAREV